MWKDPIIEEIHKIREEHAKKFDYDLYAIVKDYQQQQKQSGRNVISFEVNQEEFYSVSEPVNK